MESYSITHSIRMPIYTCQFCHETFTRKLNLDRHQRTTSYCLALQGKNQKAYKCEHCGGSYTRQDSLTKHQKTCGVSAVNMTNTGVIINHLDTLNQTINQTVNMNVNITPARPFTMKDLTKDYILTRLAPVLTKEIIKSGMGAITELIVDVLLQKDGKYCYYCTNKRDKKFTMLIDHEGQVIHERDPNAQCLRSILCIPLQKLVGEIASKHEEKKVVAAVGEISELRRDGGAFSVALASILPADSDGVPESMKRMIEDAENDPEAVELEEQRRKLMQRMKQSICSLPLLDARVRKE